MNDARFSTWEASNWQAGVVLKDSLPAPKPYKYIWFMDMELEADPVGYDPLTGSAVYWGKGCQIACEIPLYDDYDDIPF